MTDAANTHDDLHGPDQAPDASAAGPLPGADDDCGLAPRPRQRKPRPDPLVGRDLGGVRIDALVCEGGMGRVYRATQIRPVRTVAVKVVRPGVTAELAERRVENEATFLAKLQHPGIAQTSRPAPTRATLVTCRSS
jgi:hypothetical protein